MSYIEKLCSCNMYLDREEKQREVLKYFEDNDNIHKKLKVIHITGTAGKGSTSTMIAQTLSKAGFKVGLLTSPHLCDLNERFKIDNEPIPTKLLEDYIKFFMDLIPGLSFNMYLTLIATQYFYDEKVDYFVCEVFVGGRYDTTNIYDNIATAITSIGLDHQHLLGDTKEKILRDKLGILRKNVPIFIRIDNEIVHEEVEKIGADLRLVTGKVKTSLLGDFQEENAAIAFELLKYLGLDEEQIKEGFQNVEFWGRTQFIEDNILVDSAHNELAMTRLMDFIKDEEHDKLYVLFAMSGQHKFSEFERQLSIADKIVFTKPDMFKILNPKEYAPPGSEIIEDPQEALEKLKSQLTEGDLLVVCGSLFLVGEILSLRASNK